MDPIFAGLTDAGRSIGGALIQKQIQGREDEKQLKLEGLLSSENPDLNAVAAMNPEIANYLTKKNHYAQLEAQKQQLADLDAVGNIASIGATMAPVEARKYLNTQLNQGGHSEAIQKEIAEALSMDDDEMMNDLRLGAQYVSKHKETVAPASVREYEFFNSLDDKGKERYLTMKRADPMFKMGDVTMKGNQLNNTAAPVTENGTGTQSSIQQELTEQSAVKAATEKAAAAAITKSEEAFSNIAPIRQNIANYDEVIRLIDDGAETGAIAARLPSVRQASIELDNLQGKLGLDVISNTTFGALSAPELKFALDTALPKNLEGPALKDWVTRKKAAQEKLLAYTERAATYLGTPGNTIAGWIKEQKSGKAADVRSDIDAGLLEFMSPEERALFQ